MRLPEPPLLVITDRRQARRPLEEVAAAVFDGGCRWLSLREKDLSPPDRLDLLRRLVAIGRHYGAVVGVHDDVEAARATGAGALHLPDPSLVTPAKAGVQGSPASLALGSRFRGNDEKKMLIGMSAHNAAGVARAAAHGADYATLSPIFVSASKPEYGPALGLARLSEAARASKLPLLALGGIDESTLASTIEAGASGVAVMGEAMRADDPSRTIAALITRLRHALAARADPGHSLENPAQKGMPP